MTSSLYVIIASSNLLKKAIALSLFQASVLLFYISMAKVNLGQPPVTPCLNYLKCPQLYANPLPHVLMLTAIVVGVATLAVALALIIRIYQAYGTIDSKQLEKINND
jgi:multicomponent Na+:H+ antiporter subunit C